MTRAVYIIIPCGFNNKTLSTFPGTLLETKNISALRGGDVTFVVDIIKESGIQDIQWVKNGVNFATTKPFQGVTIRDNVYDGRLRGSDDGSLIIHNLAMEDQGEYKADIVMLNLENYKIVYSLHISGRFLVLLRKTVLSPSHSSVPSVVSRMNPTSVGSSLLDRVLEHDSGISHLGIPTWGQICSCLFGLPQHIIRIWLDKNTAYLQQRHILRICFQSL